MPSQIYKTTEEWLACLRPRESSDDMSNYHHGESNFLIWAVGEPKRSPYIKFPDYTGNPDWEEISQALAAWKEYVPRSVDEQTLQKRSGHRLRSYWQRELRQKWEASRDQAEYEKLDVTYDPWKDENDTAVWRVDMDEWYPHYCKRKNIALPKGYYTLLTPSQLMP
ncbi:hypothetical protein TWF569_008335 [Orbilia oligospora]|uniref:Uncharacterized protein n=1 Tax=Orbilia oligospora TaxID=2813651 RepID=A0A7C8JD83_ORBOL|nr:hypothetical protein TWF706_007003 [Orbilia oligospora]KAF3112091.1 hypothetical protein TWF102_005835 [Orbilia oligospora]KAF3113325.1 hypothetical protein TWF103_002487 [Orbilia oligospora]KAF3140195.1 hypothetical protein TWF569_008335 [Orbilia oligospora]KAF3146728.1 hypothetical protein TWF703_003999 [Orbilia oligospora]